MGSLSPLTLTSVAETTKNLASDGAAYSSNFNFQLMMLGITFLYLVIRNYDFKQLPLRWSWSILGPVKGTARKPEMVIPTPITNMLPHF